MTDIAAAFGLVLVIEGLLWALAPDTARRTLEMVASMPPDQVKLLGTAAYERVKKSLKFLANCDSVV